MVIEARQRQSPRGQGKADGYQGRGRGSHPEAKARQMGSWQCQGRGSYPEAAAREMEIVAMPRQRQSRRGQGKAHRD